MFIPPYVVTISIVLVIFPTIIAVGLRFFLYRHLKFLEKNTRKIVRGESLRTLPRFLEKLEQRLTEDNLNWEKLNTQALLYSLYSQEYFRFLAIPLPCDSVNYFSQILPLLILAFGLIVPLVLISINIANFQSLILSLNLNDTRALVESLQQPLVEIGLILLISVIALSCSAILFLTNLIWNTTRGKINLIYCLADYLDNYYLPNNKAGNNLAEALEAVILKVTATLTQLVNNLAISLKDNVAEPLELLAEDNAKIVAQIEQLGEFFQESFKLTANLENSAQTFGNSVKIFEQSRFPEKLSLATTDLAIAQNQYSQSSLILNKSAQSLEYSVESLQKFITKIIELSAEISSINDKYATIATLIQKRNVLEEASLNQIKNDLSNLLEKIKK